MTISIWERLCFRLSGFGFEGDDEFCARGEAFQGLNVFICVVASSEAGDGSGLEIRQKPVDHPGAKLFSVTHCSVS